MKNDDREWTHDPAAITMGMKEKAHIEKNAHLYLNGGARYECGEDTPSFMRPEVPDGWKGALLRGMRSVDAPAKSLEEARQDHQTLVSMGYLAKDAPFRWYDPELKRYVEPDAQVHST